MAWWVHEKVQEIMSKLGEVGKCWVNIKNWGVHGEEYDLKKDSVSDKLIVCYETIQKIIRKYHVSFFDCK